VIGTERGGVDPGVDPEGLDLEIDHEDPGPERGRDLILVRGEGRDLEREGGQDLGTGEGQRGQGQGTGSKEIQYITDCVWDL
jgi:hypothetical protein